MKFSLRALLVVLAVVPLLAAVAWWYGHPTVGEMRLWMVSDMVELAEPAKLTGPEPVGCGDGGHG